MVEVITFATYGGLSRMCEDDLRVLECNCVKVSGEITDRYKYCFCGRSYHDFSYSGNVPYVSHRDARIGS